MIRELWSSADETFLSAFLRAAERRDLADALLAMEGVSGARAGQCRNRLRTWGARVTAALDDRSAAGQVLALRRLLVEDLGFHGETEDYHHPQNSHLSTVMRARRGLPILLGAIWILVAHRAGLTAHGVGLPGHFVVRVGGPGGLIVDAFAGGQVLTVEDCMRLVARLSRDAVPWRATWLEALATPAILDRVLRNLVNSYARRREAEPLYRTARFLSAHRPDDPVARLTLGRASEELGASHLAIEVYEEVIGRFHGTPPARAAEERVAGLRRAARRLN